MNNQSVNTRLYLKNFAAVILFVITYSASAQNTRAILFPAMEMSNTSALNVRNYYAYLKEMAPRLKSYGIEAVWVSPVADHEDATPSRSKHTQIEDSSRVEYKEMIAALRAHGIGVIYSGKLPVDTAAPKNRDLKDLSFFIQPLTKSNTSTPRTRAGHDDFHSL